MKMVALIPARAGSRRCPGKNTRMLAGHPLIAYTIAAAQESGVFADIIVSTDDANTLRIASDHGVKFSARLPEHATDESPDIEWVGWTMRMYPMWEAPNAFAILRPTSPFRTAETIKRAYQQFTHDEAHSLRAVQPVKEHPFKMWKCQGPGYPIVPAFTGANEYKDVGIVPWHSCPTQSLQPFYIQNASLEMAWTYVIDSFGTISGNKVSPFFTEGYEGFDINDEDDWRKAERLVETGAVTLPKIHVHH